MLAVPTELQQSVRESASGLVWLRDPQSQQEYVVLSAERYAQVAGKCFDDGPLNAAERRGVLLQAGLRAGWDDPEMDIYNDLDPRRST